MSYSSNVRIVRCWHCNGMMRVAGRALSVFCPHCQKRASLEDLVITGSHPGKSLMTCGDIRIEPSARLHVEIYGHRVVILGRVKGPVVAIDSVEVGATGRVVGDIRAPRIVVLEGGLIDGRCEMTPRAAPVLPDAPHDKTVKNLSEPAAVFSPPPPISIVAGPRPRPLAPPWHEKPV